jgi:hypothetical protein
VREKEADMFAIWITIFPLLCWFVWLLLVYVHSKGTFSIIFLAVIHLMTFTTIFMRLVSTIGALLSQSIPLYSQDPFHLFLHSILHINTIFNTSKKCDFLDHFYRCWHFYRAVRVLSMCWL